MSSITTDLKDTVHGSVYGSRQQRRFRLYAFMLLCLRHGVRGIVLSWPLYFVALIPLLMPVEPGWWVVLFVFPAALVSVVILVKGVNDDYAVAITGNLLEGKELLKILWWGM